MMDNVILTQERYVDFGYTNLRVRVIKTAGNLKIYRPRVFHMMSWPNQ